MIDWLAQNWLGILIIIVALFILLLLIKLGRRDVIRKIALSLVVQAEKALGSGTGELKYAWVIEHLYDKLPKVISFLYTKKEIDNMIETAVSKLKQILGDGSVSLAGYDDELYLEKISGEASAEK